MRSYFSKMPFPPHCDGGIGVGQRWGHRACLFLGALWVLFVSVPAFAIPITLDQEFDGNSVGTTSFGTVEIKQAGDSVDFTVTADTTALGSAADIQEIYFNLAPTFTDLLITASGGVSNKSIAPFGLIGPDPPVKGGAGANFAWGVNFGNGAGRPGNGTLTTATFTLSAATALTVTDFTSLASTPNNTFPVYVAVHFQETAIFNATSETVGGGSGIHAPEPSTILLLGTGLAGLLGYHWRRRRIAA